MLKFLKSIRISPRRIPFIGTIALLSLLGFLLRFYLLGTVPAGLHFDEAFSGYNAFLLEKAAKSISGQFLPIYVDAFGDYRPAMIVYLTIPFIKAWGLSIMTTRIPSAIASLLLPFITYAFVRVCYGRKKMAMLAAFFTAISSYAIIMGRSTTEGVIDVCFGLSAVMTLILALKKEQLRWLVLTYLLWLAAYFSYMSSRVLIPLFAITTIYFAWRQFRPRKLFLFLSLGTILLYLIFPFGYFFQSPIGTGRFNQVSVFSYKEVQLVLDEQIREDGVAKQPVLLSRVYHNKIIGFVYDIAERYVTFFSPSLMLFHIPQPERYHVSAVGSVYVFEFFGLLLAIIFLFSRRQKPLHFLPFVLLLFVPIPASLTAEAFPNFSRVIYLVPLWQIVAAYGLVSQLGKKSIKNLLVVLALAAVGAWQFSFFLHHYFIHQPLHYPSINDRRSEMEPLALFLEGEKDKYPRMLVSEFNGVYVYYLFFNKISIFDSKVQKEGPYFTKTFKINHITFSESQCPGTQDLLDGGYDLIIVRQECNVAPLLHLLKTFYRSDGSVAARAYAVDNAAYTIVRKHLSNPSTKVESEAIWNEFINSKR